ncbi:MAG TPA: tyrosine--tRNA ligase [Tepidisphaeraceae bacterium]|nr:tyrosine--tRNA ligase [Tepidisphaeraceae bacterium]
MSTPTTPPPDIDQQIAQLARRCERIVPEAELRAKLKRSAETGRPLRIKLGMDPTAPDVHLGHAVPLGIVRQFQDWGHKAVIIIGDYTARVGDPTGRNELRPKLDPEQIDANAKTYVAQIQKILLTDPAHLEVRYNGEWLGRMSMMDVITLLARKTVAQLLAREDFARRYAEGTDIHLHELMYPLLQGWDSVAIDADVEMGGSDQLFNNLVGRELQKDQGKEPQVVIVTPLLVGTDGTAKMSKSKGNYIGVTDPPSGQDGMFGKVMSLPDRLMESYYQLLTDEPLEQVRPDVQSRPRDAKIRLAKLIIAKLHGPEAADAAEAEFQRLFGAGKSKDAVPDDMPEVAVGAGPHKIAPLIVRAGLAASNGEAMRKIKEGAVSLDGQKVTDFQKDYALDKPAVLKLGRKFARLKP